MRRCLAVLPVMAAIACGNPAAPPAPSLAVSPAPYTIVDLGTLGGASSVALDVNSRGHVVGRSLTANGETHAFLIADGVMQDLGTLGGPVSSAEAINEVGQVAGRSTTATGEMRAVLWTNGTMLDLGPISADFTGPEFGRRVIHLNGQGQVTWETVVWSNGGLTQLGSLGGGATEVRAINDRGEVAGWSTVPSGQAHAFLWREGVMYDLGDGFGLGSEARAINAAGQVVGAARINSGQQHAVLWENGSQTDLGTLSGDGAREALATFWRRVSERAAMGPLQPSPIDRMLHNHGLQYSPAFLMMDLITRLASPYQFNRFNYNPLREVLERTRRNLGG